LIYRIVTNAVGDYTFKILTMGGTLPALTLMQVVEQSSLIQKGVPSVPEQLAIYDYPAIPHRIQVRLLSKDLNDSDDIIHKIMQRITRTRLNYYTIAIMEETSNENVERVIKIADAYGIQCLAVASYVGLSRQLGRAATVDDTAPITVAFAEAAKAGCKGFSFHFDDLGEYKTAAANHSGGVGEFQRQFLIAVQQVATQHHISFVSTCPTMYMRGWERTVNTWFGAPEKSTNYFSKISQLPEGDIEVFHTDISKRQLQNLGARGVRHPAYYVNGLWASEQWFSLYTGPQRLTWTWYGFDIDPTKGPRLVPEMMKAWQDLEKSHIESVWVGNGSFLGSKTAGIWLWHPTAFDENAAIREINRSDGLGSGTFDQLLIYENNMLPLVALFKTYINKWTSECHPAVLKRDHDLTTDDLIGYWNNYKAAEKAYETIKVILSQQTSPLEKPYPFSFLPNEIKQMQEALQAFKPKLIRKLERNGIVVKDTNDYYVLPLNGSDDAVGTLDNPFKTIKRAIRAAKAGDTIYLGDGIYREEVVFGSNKRGTKEKPITLAAIDGAVPVIKGSDLVTGWTKHEDNIWMKSDWQHNSQQVFADGKIIQQIGFYSKAYPDVASDGNWMIRTVGKDLADIKENSFYYDNDKKNLYVWLKDGADPNTKLMEASTRMYLINAERSQFLTIKGITFRHSNTSAFKVGGAALEMGSDCLVQDCDVQWCDFSGISPGYKQKNTQIINCIVSNHGNSGITAARSENVKIKGCVINDNNYRHFNQSWHAGGIKICAQSWGSIEDCEIGNNLATGIWFDWCFKDTGKSLVANNYIYNNGRQGGIMIEASDRVTVKNNLIYNNDQFGIHYVCSSDGKIIGNTIIGQRDFIALDVSGPRSNSEAKLSNNVVTHNVVIDSKCKYDLHMIQPDGKYVQNNICDNNFFARAGGPKLRYNEGGKKKWRDILVTGDLKKWQEKTGFDKHSVVIDKDKLKDIKIRTK
jgi:parallel beta-helix repeat protein